MKIRSAKEVALQASDEFHQLCTLFYPGIYDEYPTREACIADVVRSFNGERKENLKLFLDELLSGRYSDTELHQVWRSTSPSYDFSDGGHRVFFSLIRDAIERDSE